MVHKRQLATNSSFYFVSNLLSTFAGAITLPVWTRLLSQQEYGLLSLVTASVSFMVVFSKFGLQHASLRFYSDVKAGKLPYGLVSYYSTMTLAAIGFSLAVTSLVVGTAHWLLRNSGNRAMLALLLPAGAVIVIQSINFSLEIFLRAEQKAKLHAAIVLVMRYGRFGMALLMVFVLGATVRSICVGWILSGSVLLTFLLLRMTYLGQISPRKFSSGLLRKAIVYGFPMIWTEVSNLTLSLGDRFILAYFLGEAAVGVYSVGYNMSMLGQSLLAVPLRMAVVPIYLSIWAEQGQDETRKFLGHAFHYYLMLGIPTALGLIWFRREIVTLLATAKFVEAETIVPLIIIPLIIHGGYGIYAAGLYIQKKTVVFMTATAFATVLNLGLNVVLIPKMGLQGAAVATLVAYLLISILIYYKARPFMQVPMDWVAILRFCVLTVVALAAAMLIPAEWNVVIKIAAVIVVYLALVLALDRVCRDDLKGVLSR
jgi:O-antigen/teichoic acid export membrane protein